MNYLIVLLIYSIKLKKKYLSQQFINFRKKDTCSNKVRKLICCHYFYLIFIILLIIMNYVRKLNLKFTLYLLYMYHITCMQYQNNFFLYLSNVYIMMKQKKFNTHLCDELLTRMYIDASVQSAPLGWSKKQIPIAKYGRSMMIGRQWFITREDNCWHRVRLVIRWLLTDVLIIVRADQELSIVGSSHLQMNRMLSDSGCHSHIVLFSHTHCFTLATLLPPCYLLSSKMVYFNKTKHVFFY